MSDRTSGRPLVAGALALAVAVAAFAIPHPLAPLPLLAAVIAAAAWTRTLPLLARAAAVIVIPIVVMIFVIQGLFYPGGTRVLAAYGPVRVSVEGLLLAWQLASRLTVAATALLAFGLSVPADELLTALRRCRVSPHLAYLLSAPLSLVPEMSRRLATIRDAMRSRGIDDAGVRGLVRRLRTHPVPLLTAIVLGSTERADVLAGRGFLARARSVRPAPATGVTLAEVTFAYPGTGPALSGVSLDILPGSRTVALGAEGSGRTTLARLITGLTDTEGTTTGRLHRSGGTVGYVGATPSTQVTGMSRTVAGELAFGLENHGVAAPAARVHAIATDLELTHLLARDPMALSGGERQLVGIAAAALCATSVLVLDEPYASLDHPTAHRVTAMLERLGASGLALVITDSRVRGWMAGADRIVVLQQGRVVMRGAPDEVLGDPRLRAVGVRPSPTWEAARRLLDHPERLPWRPDDLARELT